MPDKFKVEVVTPTGPIFDKEVEEVVAPGVMGEFGVLIGHTPMLTFIKPGVLSYLEDGSFTRYAVGAGYCEVLPDSVSVLVDEAYPAEEIDASAAASEVSELEGELSKIDASSDPEEHKNVSAKLALARAKVSATGGGAGH